MEKRILVVYFDTKAKNKCSENCSAGGHWRVLPCFNKAGGFIKHPNRRRKYLCRGHLLLWEIRGLEFRQEWMDDCLDKRIEFKILTQKRKLLNQLLKKRESLN